ncbi:TetR/AcrR family transcriptional regulator [Nevskia sp.]|uniref:TetR/AcrR family transcriptional regulator n=1 Tax=Nevskia sp. TaxID=1929292 RepID=UPI003F6F68C2
MKKNTPPPDNAPAAPATRAVSRLKGMPMAARVAQRRALLLEAALVAFGTRGYHAVTVREICTGARLTERYFYESFKSLEALFSALYLMLNEQLKGATLAALMAAQIKTAASPDRERIDALAGAGLRVLLEFIRDDPRRARVMLIDAISISHGVGELAGQITREYAELTRRFIEQLFPGAETRGIDIGVIATGLLGANIHIATQWVRDGFRPSFDVVLRNNLAIYQALSAFWPKFQPPDTAASARPPA